MKNQQTFSLSYLLDEMIRRQEKQKSQTRGGTSEDTTVTDGLMILKTLKSEGGAKGIPLMLLARKAGLKIGPCQEISEKLEDEGLVDIDEDDATGNDMIRLTEKGKNLL